MKPAFYEFICPVKILSGRKALANLPYELTQLGSSRPLVITDKGVAGAGLLDKVLASFADSEIRPALVFDEVPVDSSNRVCNKVAKLFVENACDAIVALGGGSVLDTAKGVNIVVSEGTDDLLKFQGVDRLKAAMRPMIAIPTTAGTGSEVTAAAVIYNEERGVKMAFISTKLYPHVALLDPTMTATMPPKITAATGMDALTHAVEAYTCLQKNPVSDAFALSAIQLIARWLPLAVEKGGEEEARIRMADAALLAGIAFSNSMVGLVHALAHATGGVAHVPHGVANSILLPWVMEYNIPKAADALAEIAGFLGEKTEGLSAPDAAKKAVEAVRALTEKLNKISGLPLRLSQAGVTEDKLALIAKAAVNDGSLTYNPEEATVEDCLALLRKAF